MTLRGICSLNEVIKLTGQGQAQEVSIPIEVGEIHVAIDNKDGQGIFHLLQTGTKTTLCGKPFQDQSSIRMRDEINESFLCQDCSNAEENIFFHLRKEAAA